eukprot:868039_1
MAQTNLDLQLGDYVQLGDDREGYIRYIGQRSHHHGIWYGMELIIGSGTHNGCENGEIYFQCDDYRGLFIRSWNVKCILSNTHHRPRHSYHTKSPRNGSNAKPHKKHKKDKKHRPHRSPFGSNPKPPKAPKSPLILSKSPRQKKKRSPFGSNPNHHGTRSKSIGKIQKQTHKTHNTDDKEPHRHSVRGAMTKALKSRNKPKSKKKEKSKSRHGSAKISVSDEKRAKRRKRKSLRKKHKQQLSQTTSRYNSYHKYDEPHKENNKTATGHVVSRSVGLSVTDDLNNNKMFDLAAILDDNNLDVMRNDATPKKSRRSIDKKRKSGKKSKPMNSKKKRSSSNYKDKKRVRTSRKHKKRITNQNYIQRETDSDSDTPSLPAPRSRSKNKKSVSSRTDSSRRRKKPVSNRSKKYSDSDSDSTGPPLPRSRRKGKSVSNRRDSGSDSAGPPLPAPRSKSKHNRSVSNRDQSLSPQPSSSSPKWKQTETKKRSDSNRKYSDSNKKKRKSSYNKTHPRLQRRPRSPASPVMFSQKKDSKKSVSKRSRFASPQPIVKKKRHSGPHLMRVASPPPIVPHRNSASNVPGRRPPNPPAKRKSASPAVPPRFASPQPLRKAKQRSDGQTARFSSISPRVPSGRKSAIMYKSPEFPPQIHVSHSMSFNQHDKDKQAQFALTNGRKKSPVHKYKRRDLTTDLNQIHDKKPRRRAWSSDSLTYGATAKKEAAKDTLNTKDDVREDKGWKCTQCLRRNEIEFRFCPNCGGKRPLEAAKIPDIAVDSMDLKQASDSEEVDESEDEDKDHSHSLKRLLTSKEPEGVPPRSPATEIVNHRTSTKPTTNAPKRSKRKGKKESMERLNKDDFIKTFEEMKHEIKEARSLSLKSKTLAPTKPNDGKPKNGRFSFSIKNWILSPRGGKKSPKTVHDIRKYDDHMDHEHSVSNSDVSFAYSIGKGRGHVEDRITALSRYNQTVEFIPDTPEFTPKQTPKIKASDEFLFNDSLALCQSPSPVMEPIDAMMEDNHLIDLDQEEDEKVKEREKEKSKGKEQKRRRKKKKPPKSRKKRKKKKVIAISPIHHDHETDDDSDIDLF